MKRLLLIRHGEAEAGDGDLSDFHRSLTGRGKLETKALAEELAVRGVLAEVVITSPAFRAMESALIYAGIMKSGFDDMVIRESIYYDTTRVDNLLNILEEVASEYDTVAIVGHNPSVSDLSSWFSGGHSGYMPVSGVCCFTFSAERWSEIGPDNCVTGPLLAP